jgi:hypothetical protein
MDRGGGTGSSWDTLGSDPIFSGKPRTQELSVPIQKETLNLILECSKFGFNQW